MTATERFQDLPLEEVLGDRFGRYSKYIIQERALPDARDGLKPVQRRILYAMHMEGNTHLKGFRKSAKTVGNVIGNYHPHGDSSVYEAMVRMSQSWKVRNRLVEMHGNNGSIDGDPAAAMRYTEARLSAISGELLRDIESETVDHIPNFDDTSEEPVVLPARYPNLLVNGSTGISAGYATEIPPHHLGEVIDAAVMKIDRPDASVEDLMTVIKGPDFPTGGIVQGVDGIENAYRTGKGKIVIRGKVEVEDIRGAKQQLVITEIPYEVNKAVLVKKMDEYRADKKVEGIAEVRDETDRTGLRIVVELKKEADANGVLNFLYKNTDLQVHYNFNMVAIHKKRPMLMGLNDLLEAYIDHQKEVVTRRTKFDYDKAIKRKHIVEGLIKALSILDEVIETIRASKDKKDAKNNLESRFAFTEAQAEAIVSLQLYRLTNTDVTALQKESAELDQKIKQLDAILTSDSKLLSVIKKELKAIKKQYEDSRRSIIERDIEEIKINMEVLVASEDVYVSVTKDGYIKRTSQRSYAASNGQDLAMKDTDRLLTLQNINTTDSLLLFTNKGNYIHFPVHMLPDIRWKDLGQHFSSIVSADRDEEIIHAEGVNSFEKDTLVFVTKKGMVKKSELKLYHAQRTARTLVALNVKKDDEVIAVHRTNGNQTLMLATQFGYGLRFSEEEVSLVGQRAAGVKGINLKDGDHVVSAIIAEDQDSLIAVTHRGAVKKMAVSEFEKGSRAKRGLIMLRELKRNPHRLVKLFKAVQHREFILETDKGERAVVTASQLRNNDRYSNGSFIIDENEKGNVVQAWENITAEEV
ncbi:DNA topoisomerase IV subunit A [Jeotgalibacillus haloalkalitolerans]|uniref:DNA topoisomerase 4 subunit A n=1 Tax=Jeotgalibacillus haloalkalitolerans TaxID=3104292 RepID=A0ABU5KLA0_9BACL|nr:DNA topoisomerase IV subunit A [Jeotgalibacillus sp. HH7-29]MDZ5711853.1 DNA topoisomerase IV subunit A [Jeotgalibacillus sp. HH7-29]